MKKRGQNGKTHNIAHENLIQKHWQIEEKFHLIYVFMGFMVHLNMFSTSFSSDPHLSRICVYAHFIVLNCVIRSNAEWNVKQLFLYISYWKESFDFQCTIIVLIKSLTFILISNWKANHISWKIYWDLFPASRMNKFLFCSFVANENCWFLFYFYHMQHAFQIFCSRIHLKTFVSY